MPETSILNAHVGKLTEQVKMSLKEIGSDFKVGEQEFKEYVTQQVLKLQASAGQKGFQGALKRTSSNCLAFALESTSKQVAQAELKLTLGIIQGVLAVLI